MPFIDARFPERVALQATGGPGYETRIVARADGVEQRNQNWQQARHRFSFAHVGLDQARHDAIMDFFHAAAGAANSFRVRNWFDYRLTATNSGLRGFNGAQLGTRGAGFGAAAYQVRRHHTAGGVNRDRDITKLVSGVQILRNGSPVTVGAGAGQIAINLLTGVVTFVADQTRSVSSITTGATTIVNLASAFSPNLNAGGRLWLSGVTGTNAAALNNLSHPIISVSTAQITINTATSGSLSGGTASFFPQPTDTLTASGEFDLPMRFSGDEATIEILRGGPDPLYQWQGIELIEVRGE